MNHDIAAAFAARHAKVRHDDPELAQDWVDAGYELALRDRYNDELLHDPELLLAGIPVIADHRQRLVNVAKVALSGEGSSLDMSHWHTCESTHCIAGWAIALAGPAGRDLESAFGPAVAGAMLLGPQAAGHFHDNQDDGARFLQSVLDGTAFEDDD